MVGQIEFYIWILVGNMDELLHILFGYRGTYIHDACLVLVPIQKSFYVNNWVRCKDLVLVNAGLQEIIFQEGKAYDSGAP